MRAQQLFSVTEYVMILKVNFFVKSEPICMYRRNIQSLRNTLFGLDKAPEKTIL